jgi:hypothetical protein
MKRICAVAAAAMLLAGQAFAQGQTPVQKYGETDKEKTPSEIQAEKDAERAYQKALGNVPVGAPNDPWGGVRGDTPAKAAAKPAPTKRAKQDSPAN